MNICFVLIEYPISHIDDKVVKDFSGGAGIIMYDIVHGLKSLGHNVYVLARSIGYMKDHRFIDNGIEVYKFVEKDHISLTLKMTEFLKEIIKKKKIDIIETCDYAPLISDYLGDIPILLRLHLSHAFIEYYSGKIDSPYQEKNINYLHHSFSLHLADSIAGVSKFILREQTKFHGFPNHKIYGVIYNGINKIKISNNNFNPYLLFSHGTVSERKGTHIVCSIFNNVYQARPKSKLKIIGAGKSFWNGSCLPKLSKEAKSAVTYIDYLEREGVFGEIEGEGIYISMSKLEAMSISMLEAMEAGKPLVLLRNGSFEEFIEDGIEGFIVQNEQEAAERIIELIDNPTSYKHFSKAAKEKAKQFTLDKCLKATEVWYEKILENKEQILGRRQESYVALLNEYYRLANLVLPNSRVNVQ